MSPPQKVQALWLTLGLIFLSLWFAPGAGVAAPPEDAEAQQMMTAARNYVKAHSVKGITFDLKLVKQMNDYALVQVIPTGKWQDQIEGAGMIMKKIGGKWVPQDLGTDLSEWKKKAPALFQR